jgi:hypothetical protein
MSREDGTAIAPVCAQLENCWIELQPDGETSGVKAAELQRQKRIDSSDYARPEVFALMVVIALLAAGNSATLFEQTPINTTSAEILRLRYAVSGALDGSTKILGLSMISEHK